MEDWGINDWARFLYGVLAGYGLVTIVRTGWRRWR